MLNTCFITVGPVTWVSTRIRAAWVAHNMPNSSVVQGGVDKIPPAENYIWVKGVDLDVIRRHDARHFWDLCDPVWWWGPQDAREISLEMDGIITTCQAMANEVKQELSREAVIIPDRFLISHFDKQREHRIPQRDEPLRFIWYGASQNRFSLLGAIAPLERLAANGVRVALTIMDDRPEDAWKITEFFPIYHVRWSLEKEVEICTSHDIAILPPYPGPWGKLKTNNKAIHAFLCGLAVSDGNDWNYLYNLSVNTQFRANAAEAGRKIALRDFDIEQSVIEWRKVLNAH